MENSYHSFVWNEYKNRPRVSEKWLRASGGPDLPGSHRAPVTRGDSSGLAGASHRRRGLALFSMELQKLKLESVGGIYKEANL